MISSFPGNIPRRIHQIFLLKISLHVATFFDSTLNGQVILKTSIIQLSSESSEIRTICSLTSYYLQQPMIVLGTMPRVGFTMAKHLDKVLLKRGDSLLKKGRHANK